MQLTGILKRKQPTIDKKHAMEVTIGTGKDRFVAMVSENMLRHVRDLEEGTSVHVAIHMNTSMHKGRVYNNIFLNHIEPVN